MLPIDTQRFLQVISNSRIISNDDVVREAITIFGEQCAEKQIKIINRKIERYNLIIKDVNCEITGEKYWIFTSKIINKTMNYCAEFTEKQLEFMRQVFSELINSEEGYISNMACILLSNQINGNFQPSQAENLMNLMIKQKWLCQKGNNLFIGVRSIGELMPYFKESYTDELHICGACNQTLIHGHRCENCQTVSHLYCLARIARIRSKLKCPKCQVELIVENLPQTVHEESMELDEDDDLEEIHRTQRSSGSQRLRKSQSRR